MIYGSWYYMFDWNMVVIKVRNFLFIIRRFLVLLFFKEGGV